MRESAGRRELRALIESVEHGEKPVSDLLDWFDHYEVWKGPQEGPRGGRSRFRTVYRVSVTHYKPFLMGQAYYLPSLNEAILTVAHQALEYKLKGE